MDVGSQVELHGLVAAAHLNGRIGTIEKTTDDRLVVGLSGKDGAKKELVRIKAANLRYIAVCLMYTLKYYVCCLSGFGSGWETQTKQKK